MNTIVNTKPAAEEDFNPVDRPRANLTLTASNHLLGSHPRPLILIGREPVDGLPTRKALLLLDALLPASWERLADASEDSEFAAHGSFLKAQIGEQRRSSNDRLDAVFHELHAFSWILPMALISEAFAVNTILTDWQKCQRVYTWRFSAEFMALCQNVPLFVKYPTCHARKLKAPIAHRLHELLTVFAGRTYPIWNVSVAELLRFLGAAKHANASDGFFDRKILPAIAEIEIATGWKIEFERLPNPQIAPTQRVRFTIWKAGRQNPAEE